MWQRVQKSVEGGSNHQLEPIEKCQMISRQFQVFGLLIATTSLIIFFFSLRFWTEIGKRETIH